MPKASESARGLAPLVLEPFSLMLCLASSQVVRDLCEKCMSSLKLEKMTNSGDMLGRIRNRSCFFLL